MGVEVEPDQKISRNAELLSGSNNSATQPVTSALAAPETIALVDDLNVRLKEKSYNLAFSVDQRSGESVVKVSDAESGDVIRQIPSEELLVLRKKMDDLSGIIFDEKV